MIETEIISQNDFSFFNVEENKMLRLFLSSGQEDLILYYIDNNNNQESCFTITTESQELYEFFFKLMNYRNREFIEQGIGEKHEINFDDLSSDPEVNDIVEIKQEQEEIKICFKRKNSNRENHFLYVFGKNKYINPQKLFTNIFTRYYFRENPERFTR